MVVQTRAVITTPIDDNKLLSNTKIFDKDYEKILTCLSNGKTLLSLAKEREEADNQFLVDEDIDPDFQNVLCCLKEWGNSYLLEHEIDGFVSIINYEEQDYICFESEFDQEPKRKLTSVSRKENGVSDHSASVEIENENGLKLNSVSEREFDQEPKRKVRSVSRKENGGSNHSISVETENGDGSKSNSVSKREFDQEPKRLLRSASKKQNVVSIQSGDGFKSNSGNKDGIFSGRVLKGRSDFEELGNFGMDGVEPDDDYEHFLKHCKSVDDCSFVYKCKGYEIVYCKENEEKVKSDGNDNDGSFSDVEIIDSDSFYKKYNVNEAGCEDREFEGDFRQQVIAILERPYDQVEYDKLWEDMSFCKPKLHHKELRNGRELSCVTDTAGKSYLDYFPDFKTLFNRTHSDKPKCLNLLRGFFFWLKKEVHDGSFKPWKDTECLSINPGSC